MNTQDMSTADSKGRLRKAVSACAIALVLAASLAISNFALTTSTASAQEEPQQSSSVVLSAASKLADQMSQLQVRVKKAPVNAVMKKAKSLQGIYYCAGGSTPSTGFDCSGFTQYVYGSIGIKLTHNAQAQFNETKSVSTKNMKPGDLVFFGSSTGSINHVGIYVGNDKYIHSPQTGEFVRIDPLSERSNFVGATRPLKK